MDLNEDIIEAGFPAVNGLHAPVTHQHVERHIIGPRVHRKVGCPQSACFAEILNLLTAGDPQLHARVPGDKCPVDNEGNPVAELVDGSHVVGGETYAVPLRPQVQDHTFDGAGTHRIQAGGGLVQE